MDEVEEVLPVTSILKGVRGALGLGIDDTSFDHELVIHINGALGTLVQNGVIKPLVVSSVDQVWDDLKDPETIEYDYMFEQVKLFVFVKTKILFDPPPPSTAKYMDDYATELLWRLRESYDVTRKDVNSDELGRITSYDIFGD